MNVLPCVLVHVQCSCPLLSYCPLLSVISFVFPHIFVSFLVLFLCSLIQSMFSSGADPRVGTGVLRAL